MAKSKIIVVDDHPAMRGGIRVLLESGLEAEVCAEAGNREELLHVMRGVRPDLAIVDITLNDKSGTGLDLIPLLQAQYGPKFPILIYSMHDEALYAERALAAGARGYLMKQAPVRSILKAVERVLGGEIYLSPRMSQELLRTHVKGHEKCSESVSVDQLSNREFEVFRLLGKGFPPREIARSLFVSVKTVEAHRARIREKLGFGNAAELTRYAVDWVHRDSGEQQEGM